MELKSYLYKKNFITPFFYTIPILAEIILYIFTNRIHNTQDAITLVYLFAFSYLIGLFIEFNFKRKLSSKICTLLISILVLIDQLSKLLIQNIKTIPLIDTHIELEPIKNFHNNAILSYLDIKLPIIIPIFIKIVILLAILAILYIIEKKHLNDLFHKSINIFSVFFISGVICSLIDSIFWGYSLDFIRFVCFSTIDIKDIYITIGMGSTFIMYIEYSNSIKFISNQ